MKATMKNRMQKLTALTPLMELEMLLRALEALPQIYSVAKLFG